MTVASWINVNGLPVLLWDVLTEVYVVWRVIL